MRINHPEIRSKFMNYKCDLFSFENTNFNFSAMNITYNNNKTEVSIDKWNIYINKLIDVIREKVHDAYNNAFNEFRKFYIIDEIYIANTNDLIEKYINRINPYFMFIDNSFGEMVHIPIYKNDMQDFERIKSRHKSKISLPNYFHVSWMNLRFTDIVIKADNNCYFRVINDNEHYSTIRGIDYLHKFFSDDEDWNRPYDAVIKIDRQKSLKDLIIEYNYYYCDKKDLHLIYKNNEWIL